MKILVRDQKNNEKSIEIDDNENIESLKALIEIENTMQQLGANNQQMNMNNYMSGQTMRLRMKAKQIKDHYESNANELNFLLHQNPIMAEAVLNDNPEKLIEILKKEDEKKMKEEEERMKREQKIMNDPMNPESQRLIAEEIQQKQIDEQLAYANEYMPEQFAQVTMLYIKCEMNKQEVKAFIDSGAQSTIMSYHLAQKLNLDRLIDKRFKGQVVGVGIATTLGKIHCAEMLVEGMVFNLSITVLDNFSENFLFGLDMLKRHRCSIDLFTNHLVFNEQSLRVPFLPESQISKKAIVQPNEQRMTEDEKVSNLVALGMSVEQAVSMLKQAQGNLHVASQLYLNRQ